jgi:nucleoside phosphorylase
MRRRANRFIDYLDAAYLELLIGDKSPESKKTGLQRLCKLYRFGLQHRDSERITTHLMGLLFDDDPKVKRWALNGLALAGDTKHVPAICGAIERNRLNPDIVGAGISALCALLSEERARAELEKMDLPIRGATLLAAVQQSGHFRSELRITRISIDKAENSELRFAGILVGLDKAPENLFSLSLPNSEVIGELNRYPDAVVAQYSVWATYENPKLSIKNLRLPIQDVEGRPPNVRKYIYQLAAKNVETARDNHEFLVLGSEDPDPGARSGLAAALRDFYFDSLEELILDWYEDEAVDFVKARLLEHMAKNAQYCASYAPFVLKAYEAADESSLTRARLEAAARNSDLYKEMRRIQYEAVGRDLFGATAHVNSNAMPRLPSNQAQDVKVLLVAALPKEVAAVRATFDSDELVGSPGDTSVYRLGRFGVGGTSRQVLLAGAGMGKSNAATVTANALRSFQGIEFILMVGIAGGCPNPTQVDEHVRLGDIVISGIDGIVEYDYVKETSAGRVTRGSLQKPSAALLQVANDLIAGELLSSRPWDTLIEAANGKLGDDYSRPSVDNDLLFCDDQIITHPADPKRRENLSRVHAGAIGTADTLQKSAIRRDDLRDRFKVRAIEMEASGMQTAAWAQGKDVFVVRGICDYCDEHKNDVWQNYAALVAAGYTRALVEAMPLEWF